MPPRARGMHLIPGLAGYISGPGKQYGKGRTLPLPAVHGDRAPVHGDDALGQGKPDPVARSIPFVLAPVKRSKDFVQVMPGDPDAAILETKDRVPFGKADGDAALLIGRELAGVLDKIGEGDP